MTIDWPKYWCLPGFTAGFFTVGVPYWLIPYNKVNLPDALLAIGLLVVITAAALTRVFSGRRFWHVVAIMGSTVPAVVIARVVVDGLRDPTSHNLFRFEVVIAVFVGAWRGWRELCSEVWLCCYCAGDNTKTRR